MILEVAHLNVRAGEDTAFINAMKQARPLIAANPGFAGIELRPCMEQSGRYLLLVWWEKLEDHTEGFRGSDRYTKRKVLLHHFYEPFPAVEHFAESVA